MKYQHYEVEFEIPNEWLIEAGVANFTPNQDCYEPEKRNSEPVFAVRFEEVAPLLERSCKRGIFCDSQETGETAKQRVLRILCRMRENQPIEPVKVVRSGDPRFKFELVDGCHRFHCALALGFEAVPAIHGFVMRTLNA